MKICPACQQTYSDDSLNFCLNDGSVLNQVRDSAESPATLFMGAARPTNRNYSDYSVETQIHKPQERTLQYPAPPAPQKKKSRTWIWVLGIIGSLLTIGGIGFIALIILLASLDDSETANSSNSSTVSNSNTSGDDYKSDSNAVLKDDLSTWRKDSTDFGYSEYKNGEYLASSKQVNYFYVLVSGRKDFKTANAATKIIARNTTGTATKSGYGLVVHSDPVVALARDYAFLIDSSRQSYRIVLHNNTKETTVTDWTKFPAIRTGTLTNELQVKDENGKMTFLINGQAATTVKDTTNFRDGIAGVYVSDAVPIAFTNLQIEK